MLNAFVASLQTYYGLDWISMLLGFYGLYLVTEKKRLGFLLTVGSLAAAVVVAVIAGQYGFVTANLISAVIATRGFLKWQIEPVRVES